VKRISVLFLAFAALALTATAAAAPGPKLDKQDLGAKACKPAGSQAKQVVDVHFTLFNDYDSATDGSSWANDTIDRHLRIWQQNSGPNSGQFCVQVDDHGSFVTFAGTSPSGVPNGLSAGINGHIEGGRVSNTFSGTLASAPPFATHGDLGSFDLECDVDPVNCPGDHPSYLSYFSSTSGDNQDAQWGWIYKTAHNGTWLNQDSGNAGDITG
jgi:hypothetical protein